VCDLCQNEESLEASLNSDCLLCPRLRTDRRAAKILPSPDSFLRACKPTEGQGWVHVLCSVFMPEVSFTDAARLRVAEGVSTIPRQRWLSVSLQPLNSHGSISVFGRNAVYVARLVAQSPNAAIVLRSTTHRARGRSATGLVLSCSQLVLSVSYQAITNAPLKVKSSRKDTSTITTFQGDTGSMLPLICCKEHNTTRHTIHDICSTNEMGESALQHYCRLYKQEKVAYAHALLRKARRLDLILGVRGDGALSPPEEPAVPDRRCHQCQTLFSPAFYEFAPTSSPFVAQGNATAWLCHKCHFAIAPLIPAVEPAIVEPMVSDSMIMT